VAISYTISEDVALEVVGFMGRQAELAALSAWCEDDQAGRLRLVTGSGWVGKTPDWQAASC